MRSNVDDDDSNIEIGLPELLPWSNLKNDDSSIEDDMSLDMNRNGLPARMREENDVHPCPQDSQEESTRSTSSYTRANQSNRMVSNEVSEAHSGSTTSWRFDPGSFEPVCDAMLGMTPHVSSLSRKGLDAVRAQARWRVHYEETETPNVSTSSSVWLGALRQADRHQHILIDRGANKGVMDGAFLDDPYQPRYNTEERVIQNFMDDRRSMDIFFTDRQ